MDKQFFAPTGKPHHLQNLPADQRAYGEDHGSKSFTAFQCNSFSHTAFIWKLQES